MDTNSTPHGTVPGSAANGRDETLAVVELVVLSAIFVVTVIGNACVLVALGAQRFKMTRMYYFLLHLCVSDMITAFFTVLPQLAWDATYRFQGGNVLCKLVKYGQILGPYLSSYVLVVTAVDRYQAICYPLSNHSWSPKKAKLMIVFAWLVSLLCCVPQAFIFNYMKVHDGVYDCWATFVEPWGVRAYVTWYSISVFFLPLAVLLYTYIHICRAIWQNVRLKRKSLDHSPEDPSTQRRANAGGTGKGSKPGEKFVTPRSHSGRGLSHAKVKTVKITVVVIVLYILCSSPFISAQLLIHWMPEQKSSELWTTRTGAC